MEDYSTLGCIFGSRYLGKLPNLFWFMLDSVAPMTVLVTKKQEVFLAKGISDECAGCADDDGEGGGNDDDSRHQIRSRAKRPMLGVKFACSLCYNLLTKRPEPKVKTMVTCVCVYIYIQIVRGLRGPCQGLSGDQFEKVLSVQCQPRSPGVEIAHG